ncbi:MULTISPECIES: ATP-binding protein [unclassified Streptomyces]|jgi:anti-sigma regulatory factor (Ser/Thr protein kinase)|uniref:ATP-binding protein n=1 Tax=unclassified Streptomyces TaxID=2593676 RepID=UPI0033200FE4
MAVQLNTLARETREQVFVLPPSAAAVSAVRRRVAAILAGWKVAPAIAEDALLVVSELLTNAIVHALPPAVLRLAWGPGDGPGVLRVEVTDAGPARPAGRSAAWDDPDEHGRGEGIVHALADRHGLDVHPGGCTRWADLVAA